MTLLLVGESNPYSVRPEHALFPYPIGASGWRLWQMSGLSKRDYLALPRRNLFPHSASAVHRTQKDALKRHAGSREALPETLEAVRNADRVVYLGRKVAAYFNVQAPFFERVPNGLLNDYWVVVIPHPSARNLLYNDPAVRERVRALFEELLEEKEKDE